MNIRVVSTFCEAVPSLSLNLSCCSYCSSLEAVTIAIKKSNYSHLHAHSYFASHCCTFILSHNRGVSLTRSLKQRQIYKRGSSVQINEYIAETFIQMLC